MLLEENVSSRSPSPRRILVHPIVVDQEVGLEQFERDASSQDGSEVSLRIVTESTDAREEWPESLPSSQRQV